LRLPNADRAAIEPAKLHGYLLSRTNPLGRFKAAFFGLAAARGGPAEPAPVTGCDAPESTRYGRKYEIRATLVGPSGHPAEVVSVWVVLANEDFPQFVTAYPGGGR
jgi:hypothetical protein